MQKPVSLFTEVLQSVVPITEDEAAAIFQHFTLMELKTDDYFVREGQVCERIGFISSGMIRHYYLNDKEEVTRWISLDNEFVTALSSFIYNRPCSHFLQAITPCKLWCISRSDWDSLYQKHELLRQFWTRMLEINVAGFEDRVYQQLASDAEKRYLYFIDRFPGFIEKVPQKYIASMIGIKPESLSRLRAKLSRKGIS
jgi:CRP-like cAMP-binding protein